MTKNSSLTVLVAVLVCGGAAWAKAPASAPAGTTGMCKDGSYTSAESKSGACSGHDGVKKWYGVPAEAAAAPATKAATSTAATASVVGATGTCKDGTATSAASKSGACTGHGGVKDWYSATPAAPVAPAATAARATRPAAPTAATAAVVGATGTCKDGTATSAASKSGACSGHGGVKEWYAAGAASSTGAAMSPSAAPAAAAPPGAIQTRTATSTPPAMTAPGGGPGQVWANSDSKVYHCQNDQWYGKTKEGSYMTEAAAIAKGYRADHGKACH